MIYIEVPSKIYLHRVQEDDKEYVFGKGTVQYHSINDVNDKKNEDTVNVQVYYSDNNILI